MTPAEILERAADVIERDGWHQGGYGGLDGGYCFAGACNFVVNGHRATWDNRVMDAMAHLRRFVGRSGISWNDDPERTAAEVTSTMRAVAMTLRAQSNDAGGLKADVTGAAEIAPALASPITAEA